MLESLDQVEWDKLNDAYGPAGAVPDRIRMLAAPKKSTREQALHDLSYTIYHQGTIYDSSVAAIPFLLEIVASAEVGDRTPTLQILEALSTGCSYHEAHAPLFFNREKSKTPEWQEKLREEKGWVAVIHEKLNAAVPIIIEVLVNGRESERIASASLLATLRDNPKALDALVAAAGDPDPGLGATAISAIGGRDDVPLNVLQQCFDKAQTELVRTVAAMQILFHADRNSPVEAIQHLLKQLRSPNEEVRKAYEELPDVGAFLGDLGKAMSMAPLPTAEAAFPLLYEQVKQSQYSLNYSENFGVLILAVMLNPPPGRNWSGFTLSREQRMAIRLVADRAWRLERGVRTISGNIVDLFENVGLPKKREGIFALLAGTDEGAQTEREIAKWSNSPKAPWWKRVLGNG
jgi:hypothetical protein